MTIAKKIKEEEKRIETGSQVAGAQLTMEQQHDAVKALIKPETAEKLGSFSSKNRPMAEPLEESKMKPPPATPSAKASVFSLAAKIN